MSLKIARVKNGVTHFAKTVEPWGCVTEWADDESRAARVSEEVAAKLAERHARTVNAGCLVVADAESGKEHARVKGVEPKKLPVKKVDAEGEFQRQARVMGEKVEDLSEQLGEREKEVERLKADRDAWKQQAADLDASNADLTKKVAELEAIIASAK